MLRRVFLLPACFAVLLVAGVTAKQRVSPALKSHHLFNLPATITEAEFAAVLGDLNSAIAEAGYPEAGYRLWKVTGEQVGDYTYLWEGNWPSQAAYDTIHDHAAYAAAIERIPSSFDAMEEAQIYNRYVEIPLGN
jgi:hypothetical protein